MNLPQNIILILFMLVNLIAFILYGLDKRKAVKDRWRIPERTLLLAALFGGAAGSLIGMLLFHHKTRKVKFVLTVPVLLLLQLWLLMKIISWLGYTLP